MERLMKLTFSLCLLGMISPQDLKVGDAAPTFEAKDDAGKDWKSSDHAGKKAVVVFFFPAAFTGG
jgi:peroxiredoxin Q/BCP